MMRKSPKFSPEVIERTVRMVAEHRAEHESQWTAVVSIAAKIGRSAETLRKWGIYSPPVRTAGIGWQSA